MAQDRLKIVFNLQAVLEIVTGTSQTLGAVYDLADDGSKLEGLLEEGFHNLDYLAMEIDKLLQEQEEECPSTASS